MRDRSRPSAPLAQRLLPWLILLAATLITLILIQTRTQPQAREADLKRWNVQIRVLQPITAAPELALYGQIESPQLTRLSSALSADVQAIRVREGEHVDAGQLLLELDPREATLQLRQRQAELAAIEARLAAEHNRHRSDLRSLELEQQVQALNEQRVQRAERLFARQLLSQEQLDSTRLTTRQQALAIRARQQAIADHPHRLAQLEAERERALALLASAELELSRTRIQAPFSARIVSIDSAVGNRVRAGDALITLYDLQRLQLRAQVPQPLLARLQPLLAAGTPLSARARLGEQPLTLTLERLAARVGSGQAGVDALFTLGATDTPPLPGQTLSLQLQLPPRSGLFALPPSALYGSDRVYRLVDDDRLEAVSVEVVGQRQPDADAPPELLVSSAALAAGDRIIITQLPNAIGGLPVQVVE